MDGPWPLAEGDRPMILERRREEGAGPGKSLIWVHIRTNEKFHRRHRMEWARRLQEVNAGTSADFQPQIVCGCMNINLDLLFRNLPNGGIGNDEYHSCCEKGKIDLARSSQEASC